MSLVIDSSATLAWLYADELTAPVQSVFDYVVDHQAHVPSLWHLEVGNSLQMALKRGRIDAAFRDAALEDLKLLDIAVDTRTSDHAWGRTLQLAQKLALTLYDAAYLELAQRLGLRLASLDHDLRVAASSVGVGLAGESGDPDL